MSLAFFYCFLLIYAIHSFIDFLFVVVVLFDPLLYQKTTYAFDQVETKEIELQPKEDQSNEKRINYFYQCWNYIFQLYDSIFLDGQSLCKTGKRYMVYWVAAMGIARVLALVTFDFQLYLLIAIFYLLEALVFEYEGFSAKILVPHKARFMSCFSFALFVNTCVFLLWL